MAGLGVRLYTDEMIDPELARQLRRHGYDAVSCQEAGRANQGIPDPEQLTFAAQTDRAMLTNNAIDFVALDAEWKAAGLSHAGIIVVAAIPPLGTLLRSVMRHPDTVPPHVQGNTRLWLNTSLLP